MTNLQQMAFDRIVKINKECMKFLPTKFSYNDLEHGVNFQVENIKQLVGFLWEQQDWLESLQKEEDLDKEN